MDRIRANLTHPHALSETEATARLAQVYAALGDGASASRYRAASERHLAAHHEQQQRITGLLDQALVGLEPAQV